MNTNILAVFIQEGTKLFSDILRSRPPKRLEKPIPEESSQIIELTEEKVESTDKPEKATDGTACIPCVNNHFSVCSGLISDEALRMARRKGIGDEEIRRINKCLDQLNAMEREDLAIENIKGLSEWERDLAIYAQNESAGIRHTLESLTSVDDLEIAAIKINKARNKIGGEYFKKKLSNMPKEEKVKIAVKAIEKLEEG